MVRYDDGEREASEVVADFLVTLLATAEREEIQVSSVVWTRHIAVKGQPTRVEHTPLHGPETFAEALHIAGAPPMRFQVHARAFFQPNTLQAEILYEEVIRATGLHQGANTARVMDLYCGTGTIGLAMAHAAKEVIGIELSPDAVASARINAERNAVDNITFFEGDVAKVLHAQGLAEPGAVDVVIVDPPRAGLLPSALEQLLRLAAPRLVYVSCNPAALAKNLREFLAAGWCVESIRPVDMFPQTAHIETIAVLQRSAS
jgi:23S rRNA (uracil1939-C5)-methyltransferase